MTQVLADKYELLRRLGKGGMAEVFLARQRGLDGFEKLVVVKRILGHLAGDESFVAMFLDEARTAADLRHPNVVNIFEIGEDQGTYYMVMEFLHGQDIRRIQRKSVKTGVDIPLAHSLQIVIDAATGLHHAHTKYNLSGQAMGIVHRDVSPQNILCTYDGATKIVDFGIAKAVSQSTETQTGIVKGKYTYMSPEQALGEVIDGRTDQFALGIVLWELLTMRRLFKRETDVATLTAITSAEVPPPGDFADIPAGLNEICLKALAFKREDRFASCEDLAMALEDLLAEQRLPHSPARLGSFLKELFADELAEEKELGIGRTDGDSINNAVGSAPATAVGRRKGPRSRAQSEEAAAQDAAPIESELSPARVDVPPEMDQREEGDDPLDDSQAETTAADRDRPHASVAVGDEADGTPSTLGPEEPRREIETGRLARQMAEAEAERAVTRRMLWAALGGGALFLVVAALLTVLATLPGTGSLVIKSQPKGAAVYIDGLLQRGRTPHVFRDVDVGEPHTVRLELPGYKAKERTVTLTEDGEELDLGTVELRKRE